MSEVALYTPKRIERLKLYEAIGERYKELSVNPESQLTALVEHVAKEFGVCATTVHKVRRLYRLQKQFIDRYELLSYHNNLIRDGVKPSKAKQLTALKFKCSLSYVYQIDKLSKS